MARREEQSRFKQFRRRGETATKTAVGIGLVTLLVSDGRPVHTFYGVNQQLSAPTHTLLDNPNVKREESIPGFQMSRSSYSNLSTELSAPVTWSKESLHVDNLQTLILSLQRLFPTNAISFTTEIQGTLMNITATKNSLDLEGGILFVTDTNRKFIPDWYKDKETVDQGNIKKAPDIIKNQEDAMNFKLANDLTRKVIQTEVYPFDSDPKLSDEQKHKAQSIFYDSLALTIVDRGNNTPYLIHSKIIEDKYTPTGGLIMGFDRKTYEDLPNTKVFSIAE